MLSSNYSFQQGELLMLENFSSNLQIFETIIIKHVSKILKTSNIAINLSPLLNVPLFCILDEKSKTQISIRDLLNKFVIRWRQEIQYQQDILHLKDQIIAEFDQLCNKIKNENLIEIIRNQSQQIIDCLITKINFDKKQLAGDFCKSFMNGFEIDMIDKINYYTTYAVWIPFTAPLPERLIEFVEVVLQETIGEVQNGSSVVSASTKIIKYIEDQLEERDIQIQKGIFGLVKRFTRNSSLLKKKNVIEINELGKILKVAQINRKSCALLLTKVDKNDNIILSERVNIQTICLKMNAKEFLEANILFTYEYLELKNLNDEKDWTQIKQILLKLPKCLKSALFEFKNNKENGMKITNSEQDLVYKLAFIKNEPSYHQMQLLADIPNHIQFSLSFEIPKFVCMHDYTGVNEEITILSNVFAYAKTFQYLHLSFSCSSITVDAINLLATSISKMSHMKFLDLNLGCILKLNLIYLHRGWSGHSCANNHSMKIFAQAIIDMPNLNHLGLDFSYGHNQITDDGIIQLSRGLAKSVNIQQLILGFWGGKNGVTDKGIKELSQSIAHLKNIHQLKLIFGDGTNEVSNKGIEKLSWSIASMKSLDDLCLRFDHGNHRVTDKGMQALTAALKNTTKICNLYLNFNFGNNSITDVSMESLANALNQMSHSLSVDLYFHQKKNIKKIFNKLVRSYKNPRVTTKGESIIKQIRIYNKINFYHNGQNLKEIFEVLISCLSKNSWFQHVLIQFFSGYIGTQFFQYFQNNPYFMAFQNDCFTSFVLLFQQLYEEWSINYTYL